VPGYGAAMSESPSADHSEPVVVATFVDLGEAEIAQAKLRAFGIEAVILDQSAGGVIPTHELPVGIGVEVRAVDADDAFRILSDTTEA
jgi:putative signal transducing protein